MTRRCEVCKRWAWDPWDLSREVEHLAQSPMVRVNDLQLSGEAAVAYALGQVNAKSKAFAERLRKSCRCNFETIEEKQERFELIERQIASPPV